MLVAPQHHGIHGGSQHGACQDSLCDIARLAYVDVTICLPRPVIRCSSGPDAQPLEPDSGSSTSF